MSVEYEDNDKFKALASILEDYTEWFGQVALYVAYSGEEHVAENFSMPQSFTDWVDSDKSNAEISATMSIVDMHSAMNDVSDRLMSDLKAGKKPVHKNFTEFKNLFSSFLSSIRRLERDSAISVDATDELTGLRPASAVEQDLNKEMQRLSRNGNPFSLMIVRVDQFEKLDEKQEAILLATTAIKKTMRPFDDAYYLEGGKFLLSLKHADLVGAAVAIARIQQSLKENEHNIAKITLSCCMSEPVSGDEISGLLKNMYDDLDSNKDDEGITLKFLDISPLERFVESKK